MKIFLGTILVGNLVVLNFANAALDLAQAFEASKRQSEDLGIQKEGRVQSKALYNQAIGTILPNVNFIGNFTKQDSPRQEISISPDFQRTFKVTASQAIFHGFQEYAGLKKASLGNDLSALAFENAELLLYQDVSAAYFQVLAARKDIQNISSEMEVNEKRLKEVGQFQRLGRSRSSDVLSVQSNIATLDALLEAAKTQLLTYQANLAYLTGLNMDEDLLDDFNPPLKLDPVEFYVSQIENRPDVKQAAIQVQSSETDVTFARGGYFPTLDLLGNYYFTRPGAFDGIKWDIGLNLVFPIFQGGVTKSEVEYSSSALKQQELLLSKTRRLARTQIEQTYAQALGDIAQIQKQDLAVQIYRKNYQAELNDYRYGLLTNPEVLLALNSFQDAQRLLDQNRYALKRDYVTLHTLTGKKIGIK